MDTAIAPEQQAPAVAEPQGEEILLPQPEPQPPKKKRGRPAGTTKAKKKAVSPDDKMPPTDHMSKAKYYVVNFQKRYNNLMEHKMVELGAIGAPKVYPRGVDVVVHEAFRAAADDALIAIYTEDAASDRMVEEWVPVYPYTFIRDATYAEYLECNRRLFGKK